MSNMMRVKADQTAKRYERLVIDYFADGGMVVVASDDESFVRLVKFTLAGLRVDVKSVFRETTDYDEVVAFANKAVERLSSPLLLFLERRIHKTACLKTVKVLKNFYGDRVRLIVASTEVSRDEIVLTHEIGADSFITKPISANAIIEKIAFTIKPNNQLGVLLDRAAELVASGDLEQAERVTAKAFEIKPDSLKCHLLMGDVALKKGDHPAAEKHYLAAARAEKLYIEPLKKLVDLCRESGELDKRLAYMTRLDTLSPLNFERKVDIGEAYLAKGDNEKAKVFFEEARRVVTRVASDMVSESLMEIARKIGDKDQDMALRFVTEAIEAKGDSLGISDLWMFNNRGILLRRQGLWAEAVENYRKALTISPRDGGLLYNLGVAYADGKQYDTAVRYFEKALEADPSLVKQAPSVGYNIATAHHRCRDLPEARRFLQAALDLDPGYEAARRMLEHLAE
ncbi:Tetratricopeptide TPR_1 repeat-containing protein [Solidesulfovibrio carbinoliphilus subsp. oakridgensis]|uniref:Tetratricopeptide TPR_1 repeat-containing protein n=1 Tax=Solidesulfovibrio carbinoliphilus subsp. oakridgensis TaxID=694327 RepID=G7Q785_9BACT|nr:tetratricopeptide repeat protein [Solidesulfovibrio carbinoliphilus]EHJ49042.1 Tetratricopeptide TPR_1 repeat-containing protein [Solidesulfovibrio carbinoliphilus subsp. oakridgensis]